MRLYVNIDHVATLREARKTDEPDPVQAAAAAERAGADGITVHLREDRRHIQDADVRALRASVRTALNLELGANEEIVRFACRLKPFQATLVPERRREITTEGGLVVRAADRTLAGAVRRLADAGIRVSLFIDPDLATIDRAAKLGVPAIELHTGRYAHSWRRGDAALAAHGLAYHNVQPVARIPDLEELNIGHSIVSNAVFWGLEAAVRRMRRLVDEARAVSPPG